MNKKEIKIKMKRRFVDILYIFPFDICATIITG